MVQIDIHGIDERFSSTVKSFPYLDNSRKINLHYHFFFNPEPLYSKVANIWSFPSAAQSKPIQKQKLCTQRK